MNFPWLHFSGDAVARADRAEIGVRSGRGLARAPAKLCRVLNWGVLGASIIAHRASPGGAPTTPRPRPRRAPRRAPRLGRKPKPKAPPSAAPVPLLPPLSDSVWKPTPVAEEEVLQATEVNGQSSLKDVAAEVWQGGRALFTERWSDLLTVRKALNMIAKRVQVSDEAATLRERRRLLRDAARRLFVRVQRSGELCLEGGPALGYVPVMYGKKSTGPLVFRANDVTALNVAWQFFLNGLNYSFLSHKLHPFFGVYFTLSPTEHFQLLRDWLKTWKPSSPSREGRVLDLGTGSGVISFLVQQLCPEAEIVASDRCPNAVFSVTAELQRIPRIPRIRVKRSDLFEELTEEAPFDLIIFNPPWVPEPPERSASATTAGTEADVVFGNDYPPELFPRLFAEVSEVLQPDGHLLVLFSNYAQCRGLAERSPMEDGLRTLKLNQVQRRPVEETDRNKHRQTRRDKSWSFKEKHQVELWDFMKKNDRAIGCALVLEICAKFGADMFGDRDFWCQNAAK